MTLTLRDYQKEVVAKVWQEWNSGKNKVCLQMGCGLGKTKTATHLISQFKSAVFIVHRKELIEQTARAFVEAGLDFGYIATGYKYEPGKSYYIAMVQTFAKRIEDGIYNFDLIIFDECHRSLANSYLKIYKTLVTPKWNIAWNAYEEVNVKILGLTATPERLDGKGLGELYEVIVTGPTIKESILRKFLAAYDLYGPPKEVNLRGVKTQLGDYNSSELSERMVDADLLGNTVKEYQKLLSGKRCIVFAVDINHSKKLVEEFLTAGIPAAHVDGETPKEERDEAINKFRAGEILVICNCQLYTEGVDVPECAGVIMARPTKSLVLYIQSVSRALRPKPDGSKAIILDHAANYKNFGKPCTEHFWDLEGKSKKEKQEKGITIKTCPQCFAVQEAGFKICAYCNYEPPVVIREIETAEGELQKIEEETKVLKPLKKWSRTFWKEVAKASKQKEFREIAIRAGFSPGWGWYAYNAFVRDGKPVPEEGYHKL